MEKIQYFYLPFYSTQITIMLFLYHLNNKGNIWGNLISYNILKPIPSKNASNFGPKTDFTLCGVHDCPGNNGADITKPEKRLVIK